MKSFAFIVLQFISARVCFIIGTFTTIVYDTVDRLLYAFRVSVFGVVKAVTKTAECDVKPQ